MTQCRRAVPAIMATVLACAVPVIQTFAQPPDVSQPAASGPEVVIPVAVRDRMHQPVAGLDRNAFVVRDGDRVLPITDVSAENGPAGLVLVVDASGSVTAAALSNFHQVVQRILQRTHPDSEFFIVGLAGRMWSSGWTSDRGVMLTAVDELRRLREAAGRRTTGPTPLHDGMLRGLAAVEGSRFRKRAIIIVSDGMDTNSQATLDDAEAGLRGTSALVYSFMLKSEQRDSPRLDLMRLADVTGGRAFRVDRDSEWAEAADRVASDLEHLYLVGIRPDASRRGWRRLTVALAPPAGDGLTVRSRTGYLAARR